MLQACAQAIDFKVGHHFGEGQGPTECIGYGGLSLDRCKLANPGESGWLAWPRSPSLGNRFRASIQLRQRFLCEDKNKWLP
jgi:hypothetical protein